MASGTYLYSENHFRHRSFAARADETIGASLVFAPSVERQSGAREDDVGPLGDGRADHVREIRHGDHDVHADDAARGLAGLAQLLLQSPDRSLAVILRIVVVNHPQPGRRDDADAALVGHGGRQSREGYAYAHTALHDGHGSA